MALDYELHEAPLWIMASISFGDKNYGLQIGENNGSINTEIHLPLERPETPPSPGSTVPFVRDSDFVIRTSLLLKIHEKNSVPGSRIALVGLGGVGKSQLAIEYCYRVRSECPTTWAFWIHASNEARFEQGFRDVADRLNILGRQDPKINIFKLVGKWLQDERNGKWICILDNADDHKFLCSPPTAGNGPLTIGPMNASRKPLLEYLPRSQNGSIIITSRSREIALKMVNHKDIIEVNPMAMSEALQLLQRTLDQPEESQGSQQLVEELEFMPLAIVQAGSLIRERGRRYSVLRYLREFQESDREAINLLKKEPGCLNRDSEANNSIILTWQMSFDYIRQTTPSAAELLSLMSFFDRQGIPESLLQLQYQPKGKYNLAPLHDYSDRGESKYDASLDFEDDIMRLRHYSLISISEDGTFFTMHRLIQLTTLAWLKAHQKINQWREKFIHTLYDKFPTGEYENWGRCRTLFPHVKSAISQRPASADSLKKWATIPYRGAWYASRGGSIIDMFDMASKSREARVTLFNLDNEEVLQSTAVLATACSIMGQWNEAEKLLVQITKIRKNKLGDAHPYTLMSMAHLASAYRDQGQLKEAEQLDLQVIKTCKTKFGEKHPDTLMSMTHLAWVYRDQGQLEDAEQLGSYVMMTRKTEFGEDHPDTLTSMAELSLTYWSQGRLEEAEQLEIQVMESRKTKLGENHPETLTSMVNLAFTWKLSGHAAEAINLLRNSIAKQKQVFGSNHPSTLSNCETLLEWETEQSHCNV